MAGKFAKPAEDLTRSAAEYIDLKIDELKLRTAKGLSVTINKVLVAILLLSIANIVLLAAAFGIVLLLGELTGSYTVGALSVAGFFLLVLIILYIFRNKLFLNSFVKLFVGLFFEDDNKEGEV